MDNIQCYDTLRELRWPEGRQYPFCDSKNIIRRGYDDKEAAKQRYECKDCGKRFDDSAGTSLLFKFRKPGPLGQVRDRRLCHFGI